MLVVGGYGNNTTRQPFDAVLEPKRIDLRSYRIRGQGRCPPILSLLIIGCSIGLFAYVNTFFITKIANILNGSVYHQTTQTFSCDSYYCDQTAYNFINYYSYYLKCNTANCQAIICGDYSCGNNQGYDINYFYACQPKCGSLEQTTAPPPVYAAFIMSIVAACTFGVGILIAMIYGIIASVCSSNLTSLERLGLFLNFVWPKLKYYAFRRRQIWDNFYFDFRCMVIMDLFVNFFYAGTLGLYIALEIQEFWQTGPEVACFYLLIWATIVRGSMVGQVYGPFFAANRQLANLRSVSDI